MTPDHGRTGREMISQPGTLSGCAIANIVIIMMTILLVSAPARAADILLARDGQSAAVIVVKQDAPTAVREAADELQHILEQITGGTFERVTTAPGDQPAIRLASAEQLPDRLRHRLADRGPEALLVTVHDKTLWLAGVSELAVRHAVYELLHELGCRWYMPHPVWHVIPRSPTLRVDLDVVREPDIRHRQINSGGSFADRAFSTMFREWERRNRIDNAFQVTAHHHYWALLRHQAWFADHPDYFALVDGKRTTAQPCLTHPQARRIMLQSVVAYLDRHPTYPMVSVEPNDNLSHCQCPGCVEAGSVSDRVFGFANEAARLVARTHPGKIVGVLAYLDHAAPPSIDLESNVYVGVTTNLRRTDVPFDDAVSAFRAKGAMVGVYDYLNIYQWHYDLPANARGAQAHATPAFLRRMHEDHGVTVYVPECSTSWGSMGLTYWILSRAMWDVTVDTHALAADFYQGAFGDAAAPMRALYERWARADGRFYPRSDTRRALDDLSEAYGLTDDPAVRARLDHVAMYLHYLRLTWDYNLAQRRMPQGPARDETLLSSAEAIITHSLRTSDTGLINSRMLDNTAWLNRRFSDLRDVFARRAEAVAAAAKESSGDLAPAPPSAPSPVLNMDALRIRGRAAAFDADGLSRGYTAAELATRIAADREHLADVILFDPAPAPAALTPLPDSLPDTANPWPAPARFHFPERHTWFVFSADTDESVTLQISHASHHAEPSVFGWSIRRMDDQAVVAEGSFEKLFDRGATPVQVTFTAPGAGVYFMVGEDGWLPLTQVHATDRPVVTWAGHRPSHLQPAHLGFYAEPAYVYIPPGTRQFALGVPIFRQPQGFVVTSPDGQVHFDDMIPAGEQIIIDVPPSQANSVWRITPKAMRWFVELFGIPPYLSHDPKGLAIQRRP